MKKSGETLIRLKRAYEPPVDDDGVRILVERLWPRGVSREAIKIDFWFKELSPSPLLRKWYAHDVQLWPEFRQAYLDELVANEHGQKADLVELVLNKKVSFIYAARDTEHNSAVVLREFILEHIG